MSNSWAWCIDWTASVIHSHETQGRMEEYELIFKNGEVVYILAETLEKAAWHAVDLQRELDTTIKDIVPTYVKKEILSQQLERDKERT